MAKHTQPDATLPVLVASAWLWAHELADAVVERLVPERLRPGWRRALSLRPPHTTVFGGLGARLAALGVTPTAGLLRAEALVGRVAGPALGMLTAMLPASLTGSGGGGGAAARRAGGFGSGGGAEEEDSSETTLLIGLVIVLVLVLRARQQRAAARARPDAAAADAAAGQPGGDGHPAHGGAGQMPGGLQADVGGM